MLESSGVRITINRAPRDSGHGCVSALSVSKIIDPVAVQLDPYYPLALHKFLVAPLAVFLVKVFLVKVFLVKVLPVK